MFMFINIRLQHSYATYATYKRTNQYSGLAAFLQLDQGNIIARAMDVEGKKIENKFL